MERALPPPAAASASTPTASTTTPPLPLDASSERVKEDILRIVVQYLQGEGYTSSVMTIQDEANVKAKEKLGKRAMMKRMRKSILDGDWPEAEKLCQRSSLRSQKSFLYAIHKQQYLELIDQQEYQKAFTLLARRLKPLEAMQTRGEEFKDLCYLLTCKSIQDVPSCRDWEGVAAAREKLVDQFQSLFEFDESESDGYVSVPPNRLVRLLQQAVAHQISQNHYQPRAPPRIGTLLEDYRCFVLPNSVRHTFSGHRSNVKCVAFVGDAGERIATGSSDNTVRLWDTDSGRHLSTLAGHSSRVWDVSSNGAGTLLASAAGDSSVRLWNTGGGAEGSAAATLSGHTGDCYTVRFHPNGNHVVSGGYDRSVRLWDVQRGVAIKSFSGHTSSVSSAIFNSHGNLIVSGSKDASIRVWDIVSGLCIHKIEKQLGEVSCVDINEAGTLLLSASKDNANRLWDFRMMRPKLRFKGHQNTSKNFLSASFAGPSLVVGGSEDGLVYLWDAATSDVLQKLPGHGGVVYKAAWSESKSLLVSCSHDGTAKTWRSDMAE